MQWRKDIEKIKTVPLPIAHSHQQIDPLLVSNQLPQFTPESRAEREIMTSDVIRYFMTKRTIILSCLCVLQFVLFGLLAWWIHKHPYWFFDVIVTHELQDHHALWVRDSMVAISYLGN